jgi:hypothetical protein
MEIIELVGYLIAIMVGALPIAYTYSKKLGDAMDIIYKIMNTVSVYLQGNLDHEWTEMEYAALGKSVVAISKSVDQSGAVDAVLNFKKV